LNKYRKKILGIIPARGGSKGIPGKNLKKLCDKSLLQIAIESAEKSLLIDDLIISTEDDQIFSEAESLGHKPPFKRPKELALDNSSSISVVKHTLEFFKIKNKIFDFCILLQPTNPFRTTKMIDESLNLLSKSNADSVVSVVDVEGNHPYRMYEIKGKYLKALFESKDPQLARQLLPKFFIRSGDIYSFRTETIEKFDNLIGKKSIPYEISPNKTINIDSPKDLILAEKLFKNFKNELSSF
tara:strand:+ start:64 stop:786 length:723 start_codon:yes stop_codon:yes gene_type:complete